MMSSPPCRNRVFSLKLAEFYGEHYRISMRWLAHFLDRMGKDITLALWADAFPHSLQDPLLEEVLAKDWSPVEPGAQIDIAAVTDTILRDIFPEPIQGVDAVQARQLINKMLPFSLMLERDIDWNVMREATSYEAFHMHYHGLALLTETLIDRFGRRGELIAYDANILSCVLDQHKRQPTDEYLLGKYERFKRGYDEPDINTAALDRHLVRGTDKELVWEVRQCEWARYFHQHHPRVGVLLACSKDHAEYGSFNENIRLQLTSTIMEGDAACNFRLYTADHTASPQLIRAVQVEEDSS
jgi:hypothetical protein